MPKRRS